MKYLLTQFGIFAATFITFSFIDINYNGWSWEYSLAYGSVIPLALWKFRQDTATLVCLGWAAICWVVGRWLEFDATPDLIDSKIWVECVGVLCILCVLTERWRLAVVAVATLVYAGRLYFIEPNYYQQGLLNIITMSIFFVAARMEIPPHVPRAKQTIEYKEAA